RRPRHVMATIGSSATDSIWAAARGNFAWRSFGWPAWRSHEPLQSLHVIRSFSRSTRPSVSIAHLYVHAASTQKKRSPRRTTRMSYPMISKCFLPPSGTSSTLHRLTSVSIARGEPSSGLKVSGSGRFASQQEGESLPQRRRGGGRWRTRGHMQRDALDPVDVHLRLRRLVLVRQRGPELTARHDVSLLPRVQPIDDRGALADHHADGRLLTTDLLHLVDREEEEAAEEPGRGEERREEEDLVVGRHDKVRRTQRREERRGEDDRDDAADAEGAVAGRRSEEHTSELQ